MRTELEFWNQQKVATENIFDINEDWDWFFNKFKPGWFIENPFGNNYIIVDKDEIIKDFTVKDIVTGTQKKLKEITPFPFAPFETEIYKKANGLI